MTAATEALHEAELAKKAIQVGEKLPNFELVNVKNEKVSLADVTKDFTVVSFYRGGWCPYCNLELKALQNILPKLEELNTGLVAITPETPDNSLTTSEKNELQFEVLSDIDNKYAKQLGLTFEMPEDLIEIYNDFNLDVQKYNGNSDYELPMPATFIINKDKEIVYSFVPEDYTERLDPKKILEVIRS